jgi:integrase
MAPEAPVEAAPQNTHFERIPVLREKGKTPIRGLKESELTPHLQKQLQEFGLCKTEMRDPSLKSYYSSIRQFLKWQKDVKGIPAQNLSITEMTDLAILEEYRKWLQKRDLAFHSVKGYLRVAPAIQTWVLSQTIQGVNFRHPKIKAIWDFVNGTQDDGKRPRVSEKAYEKRKLTVKQCNEILLYLGWRCKDLEKHQGLTAEVVDAWMDYLIIAVLITTGVRQREVRELCLARLTFLKGFTQ